MKNAIATLKGKETAVAKVRAGKACQPALALLAAIGADVEAVMAAG